MQDELLTIEEAGHLLQIETLTIEGWMERGLQHTTRDDGAAVIRRGDLDAFLLSEGQGYSRDAATEV